MAELNPDNALLMYRLHSTPDQNEQAEMFREMDPADAIELLAYMVMHATASVQAVHQKIAPGEGETEAMPDIGEN